MSVFKFQIAAAALLLAASAARGAEEPAAYLLLGRNVPPEIAELACPETSTPGYTVIDLSIPGRRAAADRVLGGFYGGVFRRANVPMSVGHCRDFVPVPIPLAERRVPVERSDRASRGGLPASGLTRAQIQTYVDEVDQTRYMAALTTIVGFGSRYTFNAGNTNARNWLEDQYDALSIPVSLQSFSYSSTTQYNVIGRIVGSTRPDEFLVVGAHYDSLPSGSTAPGAEDNGSGTAAVVELAKVFAAMPQPQRSIEFVHFGVEEQGLVGSTRYASAIQSAGRAPNLIGALTMDMVGYSSDAQLDVLLETNATGSALGDVQEAAAEEFTSLVVFRSLNPFGSDHVPFIQRGMKATLAIENEWDTYPGYHNTGDTLARITPAQAAEVVRMQAAALAMLANPDVVNAGVDGWMLYQ
ncbi:MAG: M28 family peptidase [Candidatus Sumerlaeia bacterium]|nr:M28 family peptidase [Candidatus Sumerlaeia bacterium]